MVPIHCLLRSFIVAIVIVSTIVSVVTSVVIIAAINTNNVFTISSIEY